MKLYKEINNDVLKEIVNVLDNDGLIIFPTDTVYGISCNSFSDKAIKKLFLAKKRSFSKPIGVLTDSVEKIGEIAKNINELEYDLIDRFFPGNLTIIFDKKENISDLLTSGKNTIGIRIPDSEIALNILRSYPHPLATTSVNLAGMAAGTRVDDFFDEFKDKVDIIIDGGNTFDLPSTIVRVEDNKISILREGSLKIL